MRTYEVIEALSKLSFNDRISVLWRSLHQFHKKQRPEYKVLGYIGLNDTEKKVVVYDQGDLNAGRDPEYGLVDIAGYWYMLTPWELEKNSRARELVERHKKFLAGEISADPTDTY